MMRDTKQEILKTAKLLFNERGYNSVTTRDIADAVGISKGNLTYYFKKKEDIIEALIDGGTDTQTREPAKSLEALHRHFVHIQEVVEDNAFYFWHHAQLAQVSASIHDLQAKTLARNRAMFEESFNSLIEQGLMQDSEYPQQYQKTIDSLMLASIYWIPFCELKGDSSHGGFPEQAWNILYPLLTQKGKDELRSFGWGVDIS